MFVIKRVHNSKSIPDNLKRQRAVSPVRLMRTFQTYRCMEKVASLSSQVCNFSTGKFHIVKIVMGSTGKSSAMSNLFIRAEGLIPADPRLRSAS